MIKLKSLLAETAGPQELWTRIVGLLDKNVRTQAATGQPDKKDVVVNVRSWFKNRNQPTLDDIAQQYVDYRGGKTKKEDLIKSLVQKYPNMGQNADWED